MRQIVKLVRDINIIVQEVQSSLQWLKHFGLSVIMMPNVHLFCRRPQLKFKYFERVTVKENILHGRDFTR